MLDWITKYIAAPALIGTAVWTVWQYAHGKRAETKKHEFETYHDLVTATRMSCRPTSR